MVYFIETLAGESVHEPVIVVKIGFTGDMGKRLAAYNTTNFIFRVMKVLSDKSFDMKCERIIHHYLYSIGKRYKNRTELFILDEEVEKLIESINTKEDILRLQKILNSKGSKKKDHTTCLKKYKGILLKNWGLIEKSYSGDLGELIRCFSKSGSSDIFEFMKICYNIDILDYTDDEKELLDKFFSEYNKIRIRQKKLKFLCESFEGFNETERACILDNITELHFQEYIKVLGLGECKAQAYNTSLLNKRLNILSFDKSKLKDILYKEFLVGNSYPKYYVKQKLREIYESCGYKATPKSIDLNEFFNIKLGKMKDKVGNWINSLKVLSKIGKFASTGECSERVSHFFKIFESIDTRKRKLKYLCENLENFNEEEKHHIIDNLTELHFQEYIKVLGLDECKAQGYDISLLNKKLDVLSFDKDKLNESILGEFVVGSTYPKSYIKLKLGEIYKAADYSATAKASDLENLFTIKPKKVKDETGKWVNGFYIISKNINTIGLDKEKLKEVVYNEFKAGQSYTNLYIKQKLCEIYKDNNYRATAKAVDLDKFFNVKHKKIKDETDNWVHGVLILSKK
mgnify:CR=1 FL=1